MLLVFFAVVLLVWIIIFILRPEMRKYMLKRMITYLLLLSLVYVTFTRIRRLNFVNEDEAAEGVGMGGTFAQSEAPPMPPGFIEDPPQWLIVTITLTVIALLLGVAWFLWQRRAHRYQGDPLALLALEAQQAIETLHAGSDLKDTVMRCYAEMSQVLHEQRGIQRQNAMTPREFEKHLAGIGLRDEHIRRLTRLFESVRYGTYVSSERDKREAMDCLRAIVRVYGRSS
jgi:hypothetical protein